MTTGSFHILLFEGTLHVDKIHVRFKIANIAHALPVPVYRQTDFTPKRVVVSRLHDTVARFRTGVKFSPRNSRRHDILWWYHVNKCRATRGNRSEQTTSRRSPRCHVNTPLIVVLLRWFHVNGTPQRTNFPPIESFFPFFPFFFFFAKVFSHAAWTKLNMNCISACVISSEFTRKEVMKFLSAQFPWIWHIFLHSHFIHSKIFQSVFSLANTEKLTSKINCSFIWMQECRFEFDTSCGRHYFELAWINHVERSAGRQVASRVSLRLWPPLVSKETARS